MTSRPLGLFNAQRRTHSTNRNSYFDNPYSCSQGHFSAHNVSSTKDTTKRNIAFSFQSTNTWVQENISDDRSATSFHNMLILLLKSENTKTSTLPAIVFLFSIKQTRQNEHYSSATQNNITLSEKTIPNLSTNRKPTPYNNYIFTQKNKHDKKTKKLRQ